LGINLLVIIMQATIKIFLSSCSHLGVWRRDEQLNKEMEPHSFEILAV